MTHHEHPNVTLIREGNEAMARGDTQWLEDHMANDVVQHVGGKSKLSGDYRGKQEILGMFAKLGEVFSGPPTMDTHDVVGNDDHVIAIGSASLPDPDGGTVDWKWANVFHMKDGKVTEVWGLADETSAWDALIDKVLT